MAAFSWALSNLCHKTPWTHAIPMGTQRSACSFTLSLQPKKSLVLFCPVFLQCLTDVSTAQQMIHSAHAFPCSHSKCYFRAKINLVCILLLQASISTIATVKLYGIILLRVQVKPVRETSSHPSGCDTVCCFSISKGSSQQMQAASYHSTAQWLMEHLATVAPSPHAQDSTSLSKRQLSSTDQLTTSVCFT